MNSLKLTMALVGVTSGLSVNHKFGSSREEENQLAQLITTALSGLAPYEINEPTGLAKSEGETKITSGKAPNYKFYWKNACAFTKWVPTNQFLHAA